MNPVVGIDRAFWYIFIICAILMTGITLAMIYFVIRYRRRRHPQPADIRGNWKLEVIWTVIPTLIALYMFVIGWNSYTGLRNVPAGSIQIKVLAQQFSWIFIYDNDKESENLLVVPENTPVQLHLESLDVIHSFYLPAFRIKIDALKNYHTYAWFRTQGPGEFDIQCSEYCGVGHADMLAKLKVVSKKDYAAWLAQESE